MTRVTKPSWAAFHVPFEHGAWWAFASTLAGAWGLALFRDADSWACLGTGVALAAGFVLQDWAQALIGAVLRRRSQALSQWRAPQGWALAALALAGLGLQLARVAPAERGAWLCLWLGLALAAGLGLLGRVLQSGRGRRSLAFTALLLAAPALPLGILGLGFGARAWEFWAWPLAYYPAATLAAQSYIRGFPERARWAGPAMAAALAVAALVVGAWMAAVLLALNAALLWRSIQRRWTLQPQGLPAGGAIRAFGRTQAAFGVGMTLVWVGAFAR